MAEPRQLFSHAEAQAPVPEVRRLTERLVAPWPQPELLRMDLTVKVRHYYAAGLARRLPIP